MTLTLSLLTLLSFGIIIYHSENGCVCATSDEPLLTYEYLYNEGVKYYLDNNWEQCVNHFEFAVEDYHWWRENMISCRRKCYAESEAGDHIFPAHYKFESVFEDSVKNTLCLVKCKRNVFGKRTDVTATEDVDTAFDIRKPYDYLQLCYFKLNQFQEAANAAATVLDVQPEHEVMQTNLKYYLEMGELELEDAINLEMKEFTKEYSEGDVAYSEERYEDTIKHMEKSLTLFLKELEDCRLLCDNPFNQGWYPDFISSIANHYTFTLRCKRKCIDKISTIYGEQIDGFIASVLNYLQYSYYKVGDLVKGCEAVESYLTLLPEDSVQLRNRQYFWTMDGIKEEFFTPRKEVVSFKERMDLETELMAYIESNFLFLNDKDEHSLDDEQTATEKMKSLSMKTAEESFLRSRKVDHLNRLSEMKIQVLARDEDLKGKNRVMAEGFLSKEECDVLSQLTQMGSIEGDGYQNGKSPHTPSENFEGVTLSRATMMVNAGLLEPEILEMILRMNELSIAFLEHHFGLLNSLFASFTHLVCRSPISGSKTNRSVTDLSHSIHVDNCILQPGGECLKIPPAYTFRDYSAILYLSDSVVGGEFIFSTDQSGMNYQSKISPKCGRLVGFSAGKENPHGVRPVLKGSRCALAMWFTFNKKYKEFESTMAEELLAKIKGEIKVDNT